MQCPLCGREVEDLVGGLCTRCASERKPFLTVPEIVDITRCAHCGRLERSGAWVVAPLDLDAFVAAAVPHQVDVDADLGPVDLTVAVKWEDPRNATGTIQLKGSFHGHPVERAGATRIRLKASSCNDCSRRYGGYFESIIQVRAADERVMKLEGDRVLHKIADMLERFTDEQRTGAFSSKTERVRGGYDLYMGSTEISRLVAREVADRYGAEYAESSKLVGRKDGRDLMRFTLMVRLPAYITGDFVLLDGAPFKVLRHEKRMLTLWDLERKERHQRDPKRVKEIKVIGHGSDEKDAVVVSYHDGALQVLDPVTYKTVDLEARGEFAAKESVRVFRWEERLFLLPDAKA